MENHERAALPHRAVRAFALACLLAVVVSGGSFAQGGGAAIDEEKLIQRLKQEVMKELRDSDFLKRQIELGIEDYVRKQAAARRRQQAAAQAKAEREASERAKRMRRVSPDRDHIRGDPKARISLIEYSDFECPFCKRFHPTALQALQAYRGKLNWVYRHFPLPFHNPGATREAEAAECAAVQGGNKAFWAYGDAIYARTTSNGKGFPADRLTPLAKEIGLDAERFDDCLKNRRTADRVKEDIADGRKIGVSGTPSSILLDNKTGAIRVATGALPLAQLRARIDALLKTP